MSPFDFLFKCEPIRTRRRLRKGLLQRLNDDAAINMDELCPLEMVCILLPGERVDERVGGKNVTARSQDNYGQRR